MLTIPNRQRALGAASALLTVAFLGAGSLLSASPASADPGAQTKVGQISGQLQGAEAKAQQLASQIQSDSDHLEVLDQQYETAQGQVQSLDQSLLQTAAEVAATQATVNGTESLLRQQALATYTNGGTDVILQQLFAPGNEKSSLTDAYQHVVSTDLSGTIDRLDAAETQLSHQEGKLQSTEQAERASAAQISSSQAQAHSLMASEQSALGQVKGQIATLVAQRQAEEAAAAVASFQSQLSQTHWTGPLDPNAPVSPAAAVAIKAAESQLGVPYVWGGESPSRGFDCSGLTQWSWRQAGVSLPRTAQEQYDAIAHVPLTALQPGDLLFWDDGTSSVQHVAMYVGAGQVIQAPHTGTTVSFSAIWGSGLVGAGRP